jgi:serine/threonine-protein kinase HipA
MLHTVGQRMAGQVSLSGVQRKISAGLSSDRLTLQVGTQGGQFILKPATATYPALPENEHLSMRLAKLLDVETPLCGLVPMQDGSLSYIVHRFDRPWTGGKRRQEDFCQLSGRPAKDKYTGSAELCARLVRANVAEPLVDLLQLYRMFICAWCMGNGDLHLKNLSVFDADGGLTKITPAYDLVNTRLTIRDDTLALPIQGRKARLRRADWLAFAAYCAIPTAAAARALTRPAARLPQVIALIQRSYLPEPMRLAYLDFGRKARSFRAGM